MQAGTTWGDKRYVCYFGIYHVDYSYSQSFFIALRIERRNLIVWKRPATLPAMIDCTAVGYGAQESGDSAICPGSVSDPPLFKLSLSEWRRTSMPCLRMSVMNGYTPGKVALLGIESPLLLAWLCTHVAFSRTPPSFCGNDMAEVSTSVQVKSASDELYPSLSRAM